MLPGSDRIFSVVWKGFAYETVDTGKSVIKFLSPGAYYTKMTEDNARYLLPWEKLKIFLATKKVLAKIYLEYTAEEGKIIPYEAERTILVKYNYIDKGINYGALAIILLVVLVAWFLLRRRDDRIEELEEEVDELEDEVDEFEKAKKMAKTAIAKKQSLRSAAKNTPSLKTPAKKVDLVESPIKKKAPAKKSPTKKPSDTEVK